MLSEALIKTKLTPGPDQGKPLPETIPNGLADGVIFLGPGVEAVEDKEGSIHAVKVPSLQKNALRYLRPMPALWRALNRMKLGVAMPHGIEPIFTKEMYELQRTTRRELQWLFTCDESGIYAAHPKYIQRWRVFNVEPGVWAVLLD